MLYTKTDIINHLVTIQNDFAYYAINSTPEQTITILAFSEKRIQEKIKELQNCEDSELISIYEKQKHCQIKKFGPNLFFISEEPLLYACQILSMI